MNPVLSDECTCVCHVVKFTGAVRHTSPCCEVCPICKKNIVWDLRRQHAERFHGAARAPSAPSGGRPPPVPAHLASKNPLGKEGQ